MAECSELKMVMSFRVSELQVLLGFAGQNKSGRKHELVTRALQLLQADCGPAVRMKVQELYRRRYPRKPSAAVAQAVAEYPYHAALALSQLYEAASAPAPHELLAPPAPRKLPAPPPSSSTAPVAAAAPGHAKTASQQQQQAAGGRGGGGGRARAAARVADGAAPVPPPPQVAVAQAAQAAQAVQAAPVQLTHLPFYDVLHELVPPTALVGNNGQRYQETYFTFALSSQDISMLSGSRDFFPGDEGDFPVQLQLRFCLADSGAVQDDNFPPNLCVKVNGKPCMLPGYLPPSKNGAEPKRPSRPINVTPYMRLSTSTHNHVSVVWTSDYGKSFAVSLALVRHLTSAALLQRLRSKGTQEAAVSRALIMEKLRLDPDSDIATTSLRVSLLCPLGKMRMSVPCRARSCSHLQCFDAALFIAMNEKKPTWVCPVCDKAAPYPSLLIDGLFVGILSECDEVEEVEFGPDGTWVPAPSGREERAHARPDRAGQADKPAVADGDDATDEAAGAGSEVIDLTLDPSSDEDEEGGGREGGRRAKRPRLATPSKAGVLSSQHSLGSSCSPAPLDSSFLCVSPQDYPPLYHAVPPDLQALYFGRPRIKREALSDSSPPPPPLLKPAPPPPRMHTDTETPSSGLDLFSLLQSDFQALCHASLQHYSPSLGMGLGLGTIAGCGGGGAAGRAADSPALSQSPGLSATAAATAAAAAAAAAHFYPYAGATGLYAAATGGAATDGLANPAALSLSAAAGNTGALMGLVSPHRGAQRDLHHHHHHHNRHHRQQQQQQPPPSMANMNSNGLRDPLGGGRSGGGGNNGLRQSLMLASNGLRDSLVGRGAGGGNNGLHDSLLLSGGGELRDSLIGGGGNNGLHDSLLLASNGLRDSLLSSDAARQHQHLQHHQQQQQQQQHHHHHHQQQQQHQRRGQHFGLANGGASSAPAGLGLCVDDMVSLDD